MGKPSSPKLVSELEQENQRLQKDADDLRQILDRRDMKYNQELREHVMVKERLERQLEETRGQIGKLTEERDMILQILFNFSEAFSKKE